MIANQRQIATIFGVTFRTIRTWETGGLPKLSRGKYNVADVVQWWADNIFASKKER